MNDNETIIYLTNCTKLFKQWMSYTLHCSGFETELNEWNDSSYFTIQNQSSSETDTSTVLTTEKTFYMIHSVGTYIHNMYWRQLVWWCYIPSDTTWPIRPGTKLYNKCWSVPNCAVHSKVNVYIRMRDDISKPAVAIKQCPSITTHLQYTAIGYGYF